MSWSDETSKSAIKEAEESRALKHEIERLQAELVQVNADAVRAAAAHLAAVGELQALRQQIDELEAEPPMPDGWNDIAVLKNPVVAEVVMATELCSMEVGKRYVVTQASDDGTFEKGDHVSLCADGGVTCREAGGWIEACDVPAATKGMAVSIDQERIARRKQKLLGELAALEPHRPDEVRGLLKRLYEYADDNGYSHGDYRDSMLEAAAMLERLAAAPAVPDGWNDIAVMRPTQGQRIVGCTSDFGTWDEVWDDEEPIGTMKWWIAAPQPAEKGEEL